LKQDNDLGSFKLNLQQNTLLDKKIPKVDGSIFILKADNEKLLADSLAEQLKDHSIDDTVFIIPSRGEIIEQAFLKRGLPAMGYVSIQNESAFVQLTTLMTIFLWQPLDPDKLSQFLTIKNAPLDKTLRSQLAQSYADKPGVNNKEWKEVIEKYLVAFPKSAAKTEAMLALWFDRKRYSIDVGAPAGSVILLYEDLKRWANAFAANLDEGDTRIKALQNLSSSCKNLVELISSEKQTNELVSEIELNKWIQEFSGSSLAKANLAEQNAFSHVSDPAVIHKGVETIIWWNFLDTGNPISNSSNWTKNEVAFLDPIEIYTNEARIKHWYWQLSNGVLRCKKKLILCLPSKSEGESKEVNQLYYDLEATFDSLHSLTQELDLRNGNQPVLDKMMLLQNVESKELPRRLSAWNINGANKFEKREHESFSSLSKLVYYPYAYVLNYQLGIKSKSIPQIRISPLLLGNLTHHTAEKLWEDKQILKHTEDNLAKLVKAAINEKIKEEGEILLTHKNIISLQEFKETAYKALMSLIALIKNNGWSILEYEKKHKIKGDLPLLGYIDLVLERGNEIAIVDLKWGGLGTKRKEFIKEQELQLVVYDQLLKEKDKRIHLHYYIVSNRMMLGRNNIAFKETSVIPSQNDALTHRKIVWDKMVNSYKLRWEQLNEGHIEVGDELYVSDIKGRKEFYEKNEDYLQMPIKSDKKEVDKYSDYNNLLGRL